jgi:hypothetical protein
MALLRQCVNRGRQSAHAFARCVDHLLILFYDSLGDSPTLSAAGIAVTRHRHPDEYPIRKMDARRVALDTEPHEGKCENLVDAPGLEPGTSCM